MAQTYGTLLSFNKSKYALKSVANSKDGVNFRGNCRNGVSIFFLRERRSQTSFILQWELEVLFLAQICTKSFLAGDLPQTPVGSLQRSLELLAAGSEGWTPGEGKKEKWKGWKAGGGKWWVRKGEVEGKEKKRGEEKWGKEEGKGRAVRVDTGVPTLLLQINLCMPRS